MITNLFNLFDLYSFFYILYAFIYWILKHSTLESYWIVFKEVYFHVLVGFYDFLAFHLITSHHTVFGAVLVSYRIRIYKDVHVHDKLYGK